MLLFYPTGYLHVSDRVTFFRSIRFRITSTACRCSAVVCRWVHHQMGSTSALLYILLAVAWNLVYLFNGGNLSNMASMVLRATICIFSRTLAGESWKYPSQEQGGVRRCGCVTVYVKQNVLSLTSDKHMVVGILISRVLILVAVYCDGRVTY